LSESQRHKYNRNTNVHIFTEEIHLGIMPIGGRSENRPDFSINISGDENNKEQANKLLNSLAYHNRFSVNKLVCDVVDNIVKSMLYRGFAYYEITQDTSGFFQLGNFTSDKLVNCLGLYFQFVPKADRKMWNKKFVVKTTNSIWKINIPKALGGNSGYRQLIRGLANDSDMYPKCFDIEDITIRQDQFDFKEYLNQTKIYQYRLLDLWGGTLRHSSTDYVNEYYLIHRIVRFNRAQAILREHIVNELNDLFDRLKIKSQIEVTGLPTVEFIDNQLKKLEAGELELGEITNSTRAS
jgi:hypothetical protein